ncbi:MAG TPA: EAL domain-containing protein [Fibrobacteraceae bacterium]|nr:EAL domain-containing protein [Fibrobacteraceae bacterium]
MNVVSEKLEIEIDVLSKILQNRRVVPLYQPVISLRRKRILFEEALSRGLNEDGSFLSPLPLLESARAAGRLFELDRLFLETGLQGWRKRNEKSLLSVNVDASCVSVENLDSLLRVVDKAELQTQTLILEICENPSSSQDGLAEFVTQARRQGFLVAIDDLGKEHSNLDRIVNLEPDIMKLDRDLVTGVDQDKNKRALVRSMVRFGHECGAQIVAEGVEEWEEVFSLMEQGVDLFQGYFFAKPAQEELPPESWKQKTTLMGRSFRVHRMNTLRNSQEFSKMVGTHCTRVCRLLQKHPIADFDRILARYARQIPQVECAYILDTWGEQISKTHFSTWAQTEPHSRLYSPAIPGDDHSLKDYYISLHFGERYLSDPYISQATGRTCRTFSRWFHDVEGNQLALCVDLRDNSFPKADKASLMQAVGQSIKVK